LSSKKRRGKSKDLGNEISIETLLKEDDIAFDALKTLITRLKNKHNLTSDEIIDLLTNKKISKEIIPVEIFNNKELSALEAIVKYLRENINYKLSYIASLINRDKRTIWATYNNSIKKRKRIFAITNTKYYIPILIFSNRKFAVLELISEYLHDHYSLTYSQIAVLMQRDPRTIWTSYNRIKKKRGNA